MMTDEKLESLKKCRESVVIPEQADCKECRYVMLGTPRCRWCLDRLYQFMVLDFQIKVAQLEKGKEILVEALEFFARNDLGDKIKYVSEPCQTNANIARAALKRIEDIK